MNDIKKRYYTITFFVDDKNSGQTIYKNDLLSAFYCYRDLINSDLYFCVVFRVATVYKCGGEISAPAIVYTAGNGVIKGTKKTNYYFKAFKRYIDNYGSRKQVIFYGI